MQIQSTELLTQADGELSTEDVQQHTAAALVVGGSLLMGLLGNVLFHATPVGVNVFLFVTIAVLAAFGLLIYRQRPIAKQHAVFAVPAAGFALLLGVRAAEPLNFFNVMALLGCLLIVIHFSGTTRFLGGSWYAPLYRTLETALVGWIESVSELVPDALNWFGRTGAGHPQLNNLRSVLRGALITLPVLTVFTVLLSSADAVFGDLVSDALTLLLPQNTSSIVEQFFLVAAFALVSLITFWTMLKPDTSAPPAEEATSQPVKPRFLRLNIIEASTVLGSVNVLFATFVVIQARYFFGGEANITVQGYTYAEYARRGFYELLIVSFMTMLLLLVVENRTYRKREEENVFRGLVIVIVALTFVILIAAFRRLGLYEDAYGYTRIRVMSSVFMFWLALMLGFLLVAIMRHQREVFWIGCIVTSLGFILTLNLINLDGFIARHNIERFEETGKLDVGYLLSLSDDAVPVVATLIDHPALETTEHDHLLRGLGERLAMLDQDRDGRKLFGYHAGKSRAWNALDEHRETLSPYIQLPVRLPGW